MLVDRLASGVLARGHRVTLLSGGPVAERPYHVMRNGGTYSQFLRAPLAYMRHFKNYDLIVEVCNGMPFLAPLWSRRPVLCLVNHMHTELWSIRFRPPFSTVGRNIERVVMPRVHRENLFLTVSPSTEESLQQIGVGQDRIRQIDPRPSQSAAAIVIVGVLAQHIIANLEIAAGQGRGVGGRKFALDLAFRRALAGRLVRPGGKAVDVGQGTCLVLHRATAAQIQEAFVRHDRPESRFSVVITPKS